MAEDESVYLRLDMKKCICETYYSSVGYVFDSVIIDGNETKFIIDPDFHFEEQLKCTYEQLVGYNLNLALTKVVTDKDLFSKLKAKYQGTCLYYFANLKACFDYIIDHVFELSNLTTEYLVDSLLSESSLSYRAALTETLGLITDLNNLAVAITNIDLPQIVEFTLFKSIPKIECNYKTGNFYQFRENDE